MIEEELTYKIRGAIFAVYKELGPGLLENIYEAALVYELKKRGMQVEQQKQLKVYYSKTTMIQNISSSMENLLTEQ